MTRKLPNVETATLSIKDCTVDRPTDELIEVMARAIEQEIECDLMGGGGSGGIMTPVASNFAGAAQAALQALQSAGYVIEKPFWPPETENG
jgi:hypothetical protein